MEDQGKRLLLAVVISMAILFVWSWWTAQNQPRTPTQPAPSAQKDAAPTAPGAGPSGGAPGAQPGAGAGPTGGAPASQPVAAPPPVKERGPERLLVVSMPKYEAVFSSYGGALKSWALKGSQYRTAGPDGKPVPMDLVPGERPEWYSLQVATPDSTFAIDPRGEWELLEEPATGGERKVIARWQQPGQVAVTKTFVLHDESYVLEMGVRVDNLSSQPAKQALEVVSFGYQDPTVKGSGGVFSYAPPRWGVGCFANGNLDRWGPSSLKTERRKTGDVRFTGNIHKYFLFVMAPKLGGAREDRACAASAEPAREGTLRTALRFPSLDMPPGEPGPEARLVVFAGPKQLDQIDYVNRVAGGDTRLERSVEWGPAPTSWFTFIAKPMLWLLRIFYGWVGNWGIAIILLTITVKLATLYWTQKSMRSMKEMSRLKPKIDELRERYKDDKQRQNLEMMNLYRAHNINPLGGCLPMLLQLPIWMALYSALSAAAELYQAPFYGYIRDLTAPDPYFILPIVLTGLMFLQAKISPTTVDSAQQKMMMYMMPIMFGVFSLFFPSGLTIYILTNTLLGMAHQVYMNREDRMLATAGAPAAAPTPGGGPAGGEKRRAKK